MQSIEHKIYIFVCNVHDLTSTCAKLCLACMRAQSTILVPPDFLTFFFMWKWIYCKEKEKRASCSTKRKNCKEVNNEKLGHKITILFRNYFKFHSANKMHKFVCSLTVIRTFYVYKFMCLAYSRHIKVCLDILICTQRNLLGIYTKLIKKVTCNHAKFDSQASVATHSITSNLFLNCDCCNMRVFIYASFTGRFDPVCAVML